MIFDIGDKVLLLHLMGEEFDKPIVVTITDPGGMRSMLYDYSVEIPQSLLNDRPIKNMRVYVKADWLAPAEFVIQELPDTPWE